MEMVPNDPSRMGCFSLYLVPTTSMRGPRQAALDAAALLLEQGIVWAGSGGDAEFAPGHWAYGVGENGQFAFDVEAGADGPAFETCYLFGAEQPEIVPQCAGVDPKCPKCAASVAEDYYEFLNGGKVEEHFLCPACGHACRVDALDDEVGIFVTRFYLCFDDSDGAQINTGWLRAFSGRLGIDFAVKEYWST
jgi:hypothetical protein